MNAAGSAAPTPSRGLPVSALLSRALVAFTIEFDNEFEHRMPHRTARGGGTRDTPWLVSMAMWWNCMRHVTGDGSTVAGLRDRTGLATNLGGMLRWGYVRAEPDSKQPGPDAVLRPTQAGAKAGRIWRPLFDIVEDRWRDRHGAAVVERLRAVLSSAGSVDLPDALPIVGQAMFTAPLLRERTPPGEPDAPLPALLARALAAYAVEFERDAEVSLVAYADVLAFVTDDGVRLRDLPGLGGVSREGVDVVVGHLRRAGYVVVEPAPDRGKQVRLAEAGRAARGAAAHRLAEVEQGWHERFGPELREALEALGPLTDLTSYPDGWRASVSRRLPDFPMVLHRGGYPDGA